VREETVSNDYKVKILKVKSSYTFFVGDKSDKWNRRNEPYYKKHERSGSRDHRSSRTPSYRSRDEPLTPNVRLRDTPSR
jgi:hypothetical protein